MDESAPSVAPARPFGAAPIDRRLSAVPVIPRPRPDPESHPWPLGPARPTYSPGGRLPSAEELIERTLAFSGSYTSDDGHLAVRRSARSFDYSGQRFVGYCLSCARGRLMLPSGEPLPDVAAAVRFTATHDHDEVD